MNYKYLLPLLFAVAISCKAQKTNYKASVQKALILIGIPVEADGCGNLIQLDSDMYHVRNLPEEFKQDSLWVEVTYKFSDTIYCGRGQYPMPAVEILHIKKHK